MNQALATLQPGGISPASFTECQNWAAAFAQSGLFSDVQGAAQCLVKVAAGAELGMPPFASMNGIHIINRKLTLGGGLIAAVIKRSGRYNYRVTKSNDKECCIKFFEKNGSQWEEIRDFPFTLEDAKKAGVLQNPTWTKYPRAMLFNRAISGGARMHTPDIFGGPVYTPEEMGAAVDEEGNVVDPPAETRTLRIVEAEAVPEPPTEAPPPDPGARAFSAHLLRIMGDAWKTARLTPTLGNVAKCLHIEPQEAERLFWYDGKFVARTLTDEERFRMAHYATKGEPLPASAQVAEMLESLKVALAAQAEEARRLEEFKDKVDSE